VNENDDPMVAALNRIADAMLDNANATREWTAARSREWNETAIDRDLAADRDAALVRRYTAEADKAVSDALVSGLLAGALSAKPDRD
jgi:hypothetical protein